MMEKLNKIIEVNDAWHIAAVLAHVLLRRDEDPHHDTP